MHYIIDTLKNISKTHKRTKLLLKWLKRNSNENKRDSTKNETQWLHNTAFSKYWKGTTDNLLNLTAVIWQHPNKSPWIINIHIKMKTMKKKKTFIRKTASQTVMQKLYYWMVLAQIFQYLILLNENLIQLKIWWVIVMTANHNNDIKGFKSLYLYNVIISKRN